MNLKDFSLLKEDDTAFQIGHPKGRSMMVPKKGLSDKAQKIIGQLKKTQNFAEGTPEGTDPLPPPNSQSVEDTPESIMADAQAQAAAPTADVTQGIPASAEQVATDQAVNNPPPEPETNGQTPLPGPFNTTASLEQAKGATQTGIQAQQKAGQQESAAYGEAAKGFRDIESPDDKFARYQKIDQELSSAYAGNKIDPERYLKNQSTGSKIASALAMALGGIGSGLTGQANPALQYMNNAIANDIEAQKNDQSKNLNLWKMNREQLGSDQQADLATQNQLLTIAKTKAQQAAASTAGPMAGQNAAQAILGFDQQIAQNNWMRSRLQGGAPGTEQSHVNDLQVMQNLRPDFYKDMQSKYIPGVGVARVPVTEGDRAALKTYDTLGNSIQQAIAFAKTQGTTMYGTQANAQADAIRQNLVTGFQTLHDLKRLSDVDLKYNLSNISSPGAFRTGAAIAQFQQLANELNAKKQVDYNQLGIQPFKKAPQDQQAIAWAQSHPDTPQAQQILQLNGIKNG